MSYFGWKPYVPVAERRAKAERQMQKLAKKGETISPVRITGRTIATTFWGKAWCENLERYSDYSNRLPRGRTYVRNGSVVDLQILPGRIEARVSGSTIYRVSIAITPLPKPKWKTLCADCSGAIDSLVELLQGRFSKGVMERICREGTGLFPSPAEIKLGCSCPDWAEMCKHVAAVLYGVGARLDEKPELLFLLRGVDEKELLTHAASGLPFGEQSAGAHVLAGDDLADLFGLEMAGSEPAPKMEKRRKTGKQEPQSGSRMEGEALEKARTKAAPSKKAPKATPARKPAATRSKALAKPKSGAKAPAKAKAAPKRGGTIG